MSSASYISWEWTPLDQHLFLLPGLLQKFLLQYAPKLNFWHVHAHTRTHTKVDTYRQTHTQKNTYINQSADYVNLLYLLFFKINKNCMYNIKNIFCFYFAYMKKKVSNKKIHDGFSKSICSLYLSSKVCHEDKTVASPWSNWNLADITPSHQYIMIMLLSNIERIFSVFPTEYIGYSVPRNFDTKRELSF